MLRTLQSAGSSDDAASVGYNKAAAARETGVFTRHGHISALVCTKQGSETSPWSGYDEPEQRDHIRLDPDLCLFLLMLLLAFGCATPHETVTDGNTPYAPLATVDVTLL